jgi:hypothetical protein
MTNRTKKYFIILICIAAVSDSSAADIGCFVIRTAVKKKTLSM